MIRQTVSASAPSGVSRFVEVSWFWIQPLIRQQHGSIEDFRRVVRFFRKGHEVGPFLLMEFQWSFTNVGGLSKG